MTPRSTPVLHELTSRLRELKRSLRLTSDPLEKRDLLKEFRIVLDLADEVIGQEFLVGLDDHVKFNRPAALGRPVA